MSEKIEYTLNNSISVSEGDTWKEKINKQYNINIKHIVIGMFSDSVLTQYKERGYLTNAQLRGLLNVSEAHEKYLKRGKQIQIEYEERGVLMRREYEERGKIMKRIRNSYGNYDDRDSDGPWNDLGSMGYLN